VRLTLIFVEIEGFPVTLIVALNEEQLPAWQLQPTMPFALSNDGLKVDENQLAITPPH